MWASMYIYSSFWFWKYYVFMNDMIQDVKKKLKMKYYKNVVAKCVIYGQYMLCIKYTPV